MFFPRFVALTSAFFLIFGSVIPIFALSLEPVAENTSTVSPSFPPELQKEIDIVQPIVEEVQKIEEKYDSYSSVPAGTILSTMISLKLKQWGQKYPDISRESFINAIDPSKKTGTGKDGTFLESSRDWEQENFLESTVSHSQLLYDWNEGLGEISTLFSGDNTPLSGNEMDIITGKRAMEESLQTGSIGSTRPGEANPENQTVYIKDIPAVETKSHNYDQLIQQENLAEKIKVPEIMKLVPADMMVVHFADKTKFDSFLKGINALSEPLQKVMGKDSSVQAKEVILKRLGITDEFDVAEEFAFVAEDLDFVHRNDFALIVKFKNKSTDIIAKMMQTGENRFGTVGDYFVFATSQDMMDCITMVFTKEAPLSVSRKAYELGHHKNIEEATRSLADEKDFHYALGVLDPRKDGIIYFSDAFIRKLTSPEYRLNARRKNGIMQEVIKLQYEVFAYRGLEGVWPKNFKEMADKKYETSTTLDESFRISDQGIVSHIVWGSLAEPTPINHVQIDLVTKDEEALYTRFRNGYQNFFREFFDPIGIAILVGDRISFHTIILPLIDNSEYNWVKAIFGGNGKEEFRFLSHADLYTGIASFLVTKWSLDDALAKIGQMEIGGRSWQWQIRDDIELYSSEKNTLPNTLEDLNTWSKTNPERRQYLEEYFKETGLDYKIDFKYEVYEGKTKGSRQCWRVTNLLTGESTGNINEDECSGTVLPEITPRPMNDELQQKYINTAEKWIKEEFTLPENERVFDFFGKEMMVGIMDNFSVSTSNFSNIHGFLAFEIQNVPKMKKFMEIVYNKVFSSEMKNSDIGQGLSMLGIGGKPLSKDMNGKEVFIIPLRWLDFYYFFTDDRFYITPSRQVAEKITLAISQKNPEQTSFSPPLPRILDYTSNTGNLLLAFDLEKFYTGINNEKALYEDFSEYTLRNEFQQKASYVEESFILAKILNSDVPNLEAVKPYYSHIPTHFYTLPFVIAEKKIAIKGPLGDIPLEKIDSKYSYIALPDNREDGKITIKKLLEGVNLENPFKIISETVKSGGVSFAFTPHGVDIRTAVYNPAWAEKDDVRFGVIHTVTDEMISNLTYKLFFIGCGIFLFLGVLFIILKKHKETPNIPDTLSENSSQNISQ